MTVAKKNVFVANFLVTLLLAACRDAAPIAPSAHVPSQHASPREVATSNRGVHFPLHHLIRAGASVYLARLSTKDVTARGPGTQATHLSLSVLETLFGTRGASQRGVDIVEPASEIARRKFLVPQWWLIRDLDPGALVLLITTEQSESVTDVAYVEHVNSIDDARVTTLRKMLKAESAPTNPAMRRERYVEWLSSSDPLKILFGGAALAKDDLPDVDPAGQLMPTFANAILHEHDPQLRSALYDWAWRIYPRTNLSGRVTMLHALVLGTVDTQEKREPGAWSLSGACLDMLFEAPAQDLSLLASKMPDDVRMVEKRASEEKDEGAKSQLEGILRAMQKTREK